VDCPASYTWSARQYRRGYAGSSSWMGSLIFESRDASGLYYRRSPTPVTPCPCDRV
jgi:hypothetical protein